ncbi:MAG: hypothetical protein JWP91_1567 [Fibrobacteres bacterium]|nr:hypothetical protein [Fibrobacterota bacterium]
MSTGNVEKAILAEMGKPQSGLIDRVTRHNQIFLHNFTQSVERSCECQLMGCTQSFDLTLIPNQVLYPKYCEEHRSEYRRSNFMRQIAAQPEIYRFDTVKVISEPAPPYFAARFSDPA